jgi:hypothetical protein
MKRIITQTTWFLFIFASMQIHAQKVDFGVIGGINFADMYIKGDGKEQDVASHQLFGMGAILNIHVSRYLSLQANPMYLQKGGTMMQDDPDPDARIKTSFIEVPLFIRADFGKTIRPYVLAGPSFGFLLTSKAEIKFAGYVLEADLKEITRKLATSFSMGTGIEFPLWMGSVFLQGTYTFNLTNLNKGGTFNFMLGNQIVIQEQTEKEDIFKNRGIQIIGITEIFARFIPV